MITSLLRPQSRLTKNLLPASVVVGIGLNVFVVLLMIAQGLKINKLETKDPPRLVQMVDGRSIAVEPIAHNQRTPESIRRFVNDTMTLMFTWTGTLPPQTPQEAKVPLSDPGVRLKSPKGGYEMVTTASWEASFALASSFRREFIMAIAALTPEGVFKRGEQVILVVQTVSDPAPIREGEWKVDLVGSLLVFDSRDKSGETIPFNKEIFVRAVEPPALPLGEGATEFQKTVYRVRQAGLEIYKIRDLEIRTLD